MSEFAPVIVVPVASGRIDNVRRLCMCIEQQTVFPLGVVFVEDGPGDYPSTYLPGEHVGYQVYQSAWGKHQPGMEQPRNIGVRAAMESWPEANAVWFLDSDIIFKPHTLEHYRDRWEAVDHGRIIIGPYDWMQDGETSIEMAYANDPRWEMMNELRWDDLAYESTGQINVGLGCFSGNLVWPIDEFCRMGGFWNELHHGRCEDGELGLRAVQQEVPITIERAARGWHVAHSRNQNWIIAANTRDVPMINERHPWVEGHGLFVVEKDGKRFDQICPDCHCSINTGAFWSHAVTCHSGA